MQSIRQYILSADRVTLIQYGLLVSCLIDVVSIVLLLAFGQTNLVFFVLIWLLTQAVTLVLLWRGHPQLASWTIIGTLMVMLTLAPLVIGLGQPITFVAIIMLVLVTGLVQARALPYISVLMLAMWLLQYVLILRGTNITPQLVFSGPELFVAQTSILIFMIFFYLLLIRLFNTAIRHRDAQARELRETLTQLQQTSVSENYLDKILNSMSDMVIVATVDQRIRKVNRAVLVRLGYSQDQIIGQPLKSLLTEQSLEQRHDIIEVDSTTASTRQRDVFLISSSGQHVPVSMNISVMYNNQGDIDGVICTAQDISEIRRMRHELEQNNQRYQLAIQASQGGVFEWFIINNSFYIDPNVKKVLGYEDDEIENTTEGFRSIVFEPDLERISAEIQHLIATKETAFEQEFRLKHRQGMHVWMLSRGSIFYNREGTAYKIVSANINITERRIIEETLKRGEEQTRALIGALPDLITRVNRQGRFLEVHGTTAFYSLIPAEEMEGKMLYEVFPPNITHDTLSRIGAVLEHGIIDIYEYELEEYGQINHYEARMVTYDVDEVLLVIRNINDRKESERKTVEVAVQKEKVNLLARFVGDASHDFRTALTVITTGVYLLQRVDDPQKRKERMEMIERQAVRLSRLFESLFTMMRLDIDAKLEFSDVNINQLASEVVQRIEGTARPKGIQLTMDLVEGNPQIYADEAELGQAIINLAENAVTFTQDGGEVKIATRYDDHFVYIDVIDNGIGIPEKALPKIFERLYKVDQARTPDKGGLGLGLPIAARVVELHHGSIEVQSEENKGSTFTVKIPRAEFRRTTTNTDRAALEVMLKSAKHNGHP